MLVFYVSEYNQSSRLEYQAKCSIRRRLQVGCCRGLRWWLCQQRCRSHCRAASTDCRWSRWLHAHIPEVLSAPCYQKIHACQCRNLRADRAPCTRCKFLLYHLNLFRFHTVRKIAAVSLMPALLPSIICHSDKSLYKFCI